jgi:hypothetical protein
MSLSDLFRQLSLLIGLPAVVLAGIGAAIVIIVRDWRAVLFGYALMSVMLALLLSRLIPAEWALQQAVAGGLVAVMLFLSARQLSVPRQPGVSREGSWPRVASLTPFRFMAVGLLVVVYLSVRESITLPGLEPLFRDAVVWLAFVGLLGLALHEEPLHAGLSLLIVFAAAEIVVFALTQRRMIVGLLQAGQVLLGLAIAYLALAHGLASDTPHPTEVGSGGDA